jgi:hypothetical protein
VVDRWRGSEEAAAWHAGRPPRQRCEWRVAGGDGSGGTERCRFGGWKGLEWWGPRAGMQNREAAGANCVLGMKNIFTPPQ